MYQTGKALKRANRPSSDFRSSFSVSVTVSQTRAITAEAITIIQMRKKSLGTALTIYPYSRTRTLLQ